MTTWFPIRTSSGAFRSMHGTSRTKLEHALKDYEVYLPWEVYEFRHWRTKKWVMSKKPIYPGWAFIANVTDWERVERIKEVYGPIRGLDNRPRTIAESEIERMKLGEAMVLEAFMAMKRNREMTKARVMTLYPQGSMVKIGAGHIMSGREARVLEATGRKTIKAVLDGMFGASVEVEIPLDLVEAAE